LLGFWCLNANTGELIWRYDIESSDKNSLNSFEVTPAIAYGNLYVSCLDYRMYCFGDVSGNQAQDSNEQVNDGESTPGFELIIMIFAFIILIIYRNKKNIK